MGGHIRKTVPKATPAFSWAESCSPCGGRGGALQFSGRRQQAEWRTLAWEPILSRFQSLCGFAQVTTPCTGCPFVKWGWGCAACRLVVQVNLANVPRP